MISDGVQSSTSSMTPLSKLSTSPLAVIQGKRKVRGPAIGTG
jgi:hypothetical protein